MNSNLMKFLLVGVINTIFGTTIMLVAYNIFNLNYWISTGMNYFFGSILSFFLNKYFTFKSEEKSFLELIKFIFNIICCYILSYSCAREIVHFLISGIPTNVAENISMVLGMVIFVVLNFLGQKYWVFNKKVHV